MNKQKKEKQTRPARALGITLLTAAVCLAVLAYFAIQSAWYLSDPLTTTLTYSYQAVESVEVSGCVVRREVLLPDNTEGLLRIQRTEGERVSAKGQVASVYADQASLDRQAEADALTQRLEQLQYAQSLALESDTSVKLDSQIAQSLRTYRRYITEERLYDAETEAIQLRALVLKRDFADAGESQDLTGQIQELEAQIQSLRAQSAGSVRSISAPQAGLYSAVSDGYESLLTPESLTDLTPSQLASLQPDETAVSRVGKLVLGDAWYYAAVLSAGEASMLLDRQEAMGSGESLLLRFSKGVDRDLPVTLDSIGPEEGGRVVAVFRGTTYLQELTLLRRQRAEILYDVLDGLRLPKNALRAERTAMDEDGALHTEAVTGVYCMIGLTARFKPVEVIYSGDGFVLVRPMEDDAQLMLRPGDEVILSASGLFDGKIMKA